MLPAFKDYLWGGNRLVSDWKKPSPFTATAESWELSAHKNGESIACNGPLKGMKLSEIVSFLGVSCLGDRFRATDRFPVLIKFIDPEQQLSIQVHPADDYALLHEGDFGKTEMWYIVQSYPGSRILCGFNRDIDRDTFIRAINDNSLPELMNSIEVSKGDVFLITPGTVHAICENMIIAEIQQNSDITYRVYDYDRKGKDGKPRELHIEKAADVADFRASFFDGRSQGDTEKTYFGSSRKLVSCKYFSVTEYRIDTLTSAAFFAGSKTFNSITFLEGSGYIESEGMSEQFLKGDTFFIPANTGEYRIKGETALLLTEV